MSASRKIIIEYNAIDCIIVVRSNHAPVLYILFHKIEKVDINTMISFHQEYTGLYGSNRLNIIEVCAALFQSAHAFQAGRLARSNLGRTSSQGL